MLNLGLKKKLFRNFGSKLFPLLSYSTPILEQEKHWVIFFFFLFNKEKNSKVKQLRFWGSIELEINDATQKV